MVRVFYEPPPYGPRTSINRSRNGPRGGGLFGKLGERLQKMHPTMPMVVGVAISCAICYIPLCKLWSIKIKRELWWGCK